MNFTITFYNFFFQILKAYQCKGCKLPCSLREISWPFLIFHCPSIFPVVEKAQHDPHCPYQENIFTDTYNGGWLNHKNNNNNNKNNNYFKMCFCTLCWRTSLHDLSKELSIQCSFINEILKSWQMRRLSSCDGWNVKYTEESCNNKYQEESQKSLLQNWPLISLLNLELMIMSKNKRCITKKNLISSMTIKLVMLKTAMYRRNSKISF